MTWWCSFLLVLVGVVGVGVCVTSSAPPTLEERLAHAHAILQEVPLVDGHNDLAMNIRKLHQNQLTDFHFELNLTQIDPWADYTQCHTDLPRLRQGMVGAQFWSAYVPCESQYLNAATQTMEQVDVIRRLVVKYPDDLQFVTTADGILEAHAAGRIGCLVGVEGGHGLDSSLALLRTLYNQGVRYMTLTHACNTPWADNSFMEDDPEELGGLTAWGEVSGFQTDSSLLLVWRLVSASD
ncbi:hypothetical protein Pcinc_022984 [Petrolisthes cinctipes]|uniref:Dipeptidase n=1 Tax=Petrolisthes cinctipes TaxID=88211 RepID=A0AAE1KCV0_PETCI|nr:hypothetical protein Pcinc_022984 [Petrolisthes cinctipes]